MFFLSKKNCWKTGFSAIFSTFADFFSAIFSAIFRWKKFFSNFVSAIFEMKIAKNRFQQFSAIFPKNSSENCWKTRFFSNFRGFSAVFHTFSMDFLSNNFSNFSSNFRREAAEIFLALFSSNFSEIKIFQQFCKSLKKHCSSSELTRSSEENGVSRIAYSTSIFAWANFYDG